MEVQCKIHSRACEMCGSHKTWKNAFEKYSKRSNDFIDMHLINRITKITTGSCKSMKHIIESPVATIVTKIMPQYLIEWKLLEKEIEIKKRN